MLVCGEPAQHCYANGDAIPAGLISIGISTSQWLCTANMKVATIIHLTLTPATPLNPWTNTAASTIGTRWTTRVCWLACSYGRMDDDGYLGMTDVEANSTGWRGTNQGAQMKTAKGWSRRGNGTNSRGFSGFPFRSSMVTFISLEPTVSGDITQWLPCMVPVGWGALIMSAEY